jgi:hypothetical protein
MGKKNNTFDSIIQLAIVLTVVFGGAGSLISGSIDFIFNLIKYLSIAGGIGFIVYKIHDGWNSGKLNKTALYSNIGLLLLLLIAGWYLFPVIVSDFIYQGIYLHIPHLIIVGIGLGIGYITFISFISKFDGLRKYEMKQLLTGKKLALAALYFFAVVSIIIGGPFGIKYLTDWKTAESFAFEKRESIIKVNKSAIRYTPREVAFKEMIGGFSSSEYQILGELTNAVKLNDGSFGYVTPIVPDGMINIYRKENDGYVVYNDSNTIKEEDRIKRTKQLQTYGEEMEWLDNIWRQLYLADMFSTYSNIIYLQIDSKDKTKRVAVAPKVKYEWKLPFVLVPYWAGVTLVYDDGKVETLSVEEATADPRLKNVRLFPSALEQKYTSVQIYDQGFIGAFYRREGKISIPILPGNNQMPFYTPSVNGNDYFVTLTVPDGGSDAMFRIYYINTYNGERSYYEFGINSQTLGPIAALEQAKSLAGYKWIEEDDANQDGNFRIIEPTYLTKGEKIYLKFSITPRSYRGVTSTVVVDLSARSIKEYKSRTEFFAWLHNGEYTSNNSVRVDFFQKAMNMINEGTRMIKEGQNLLMQDKMK